MSKPSPTSPTDSPDSTCSTELAALASHAAKACEWRLTDLFQQDASRVSRFTLEAAGLCLDVSKNHVNDETIRLLTAFAQTRGVERWRDAMFQGERINQTEQRAALHTALRLPASATLTVEGEELVAKHQ
ncbi:MAG: glucose-6-phosphate isomerase, partial [Betaproteobacteria bacterium]